MSRREHTNDQILDPTTSASHPAMSLTMTRDRSSARRAAAIAASTSHYWPLWVTGHRPGAPTRTHRPAQRSGQRRGARARLELATSLLLADRVGLAAIHGRSEHRNEECTG